MYSFSTTLKTSMGDAEVKVRAALMEEGFGVLTEIDVQKVMKAKLNIDRAGYKILGACNPTFAHEAIAADPDIGLLLPCNVLLREEKNGSSQDATLAQLSKSWVKETCDCGNDISCRALADHFLTPEHLKRFNKELSLFRNRVSNLGKYLFMPVVGCQIDSAR